MIFSYSLDDYVREVYNFVTALNLDSYDVLAHSFGGRIAVRLSQIDGRLDKLILTGSAGLKPRRNLKYYLKVYAYKLLKNVLPESKLKNFGSSEYKTLNPVMKLSYIKIVNDHLDSEVGFIKNKTLLIFGERDTATPLYMAKKLNKNIKNSQLLIMKDCSHFAFIDKPFVFNAHIKEFLNGD